jgi:hypothetical protein
MGPLGPIIDKREYDEHFKTFFGYHKGDLAYLKGLLEAESSVIPRSDFLNECLRYLQAEETKREPTHPAAGIDKRGGPESGTG